MLQEASPERIKQVWLDDPYDDLKSPPVSPQQLNDIYKNLPERSLDYVQEMYQATPKASPEQLQSLYRGC